MKYLLLLFLLGCAAKVEMKSTPSQPNTQPKERQLQVGDCFIYKDGSVSQIIDVGEYSYKIKYTTGYMAIAGKSAFLNDNVQIDCWGLFNE